MGRFIRNIGYELYDLQKLFNVFLNFLHVAIITYIYNFNKFYNTFC